MPPRIKAVGEINSSREISVQFATPIPGNSSITDAYVKVGGQRVSQVPVGAQFEIWAKATIVNQGGGRWGACLTCIDTSQGAVKNYVLISANTLGGNTIDTGYLQLNAQGQNIMPPGNAPLNLRLRAWMNDLSTPSTPPEQGSW